MRDEDRYRHQAAYCREQARKTFGDMAEEWLQLAAEYDKLMQGTPLRPTEAQLAAQQQKQPKKDDDK